MKLIVYPACHIFILQHRATQIRAISCLYLKNLPMKKISEDTLLYLCIRRSVVVVRVVKRGVAKSLK